MQRLAKVIALLLCLCLLGGVSDCGKDTTPPAGITGMLLTSPCNDAVASFSWNAAADAGSGVDHYLVMVDGGAWADVGNVTSYTPDTALSAGGHSVCVEAVDKAGNRGGQSRIDFAIDTDAPVITGMAFSDITLSSINITWTTNEAATSQVEYGTTNAYGSSSPLDGALVKSHVVNLTGLASSTEYHYRVKSSDSCSNEAVSEDHIFPTAMPPLVLEILSHSSYLDASGRYHVVGEVTNTSSANGNWVHLTATFYDSQDAVLDTGLVSTCVDTLRPNERSPFEITEVDVATSAQIAHYSLTLVYARGGEPYRSFDILSRSSYIASSGSFHVVGTLRNTGSQTATNVRIALTLYDATGMVIGAACAYTSAGTLLANEESLFDLVEPDGSVAAQIDHYELVVADATVSPSSP